MSANQPPKPPRGPDPDATDGATEPAPPEPQAPWSIPPPAPKAVEVAPEGDLLKRPPRLSIAVEVDLESDNCFYSGLTENISEGGLFVATYDLRPVGTRFSVSLTLQDMPPIQVTAEVRWIREVYGASRDHAAGMGMAFIDLPEDDRAIIQAFLGCRTPLLMEGV